MRLYGDYKGKMMVNLSLLILLSLSISFFPVFLEGRIILVPEDIATIQGAIDSVISGDTILVSSGIYHETLNFNGKNLVLASHFILNGDMGYIDQTIISGDSLGSVVTFENSEDSSAQLIGFQIKGGIGKLDSAEYVYKGYGGGIYCVNSSPTIRYNEIRNNGVSLYNKVTILYGGGCYFKNSHSLIEHNYIHDNTADFKGGGIYAEDSFLKIINNQICYNRACCMGWVWGHCYGGGIFIKNKDQGVILQKNLIDNNMSEGVFCGLEGGVSIKCDTADIRFNIISNNSSYSNEIHKSTETGLKIDASYCVIDSNWIIRNHSSKDFSGIIVYNASGIISRNVVLENNSYEEECNGISLFSCGKNDSLILSRNLIAGNTFGGIYLYDSNIFSWNNTIAHNTGYGIMLYESNATARNCILWKNEPDSLQILLDTLSNISVTYSLIEGNWTGTGNFERDPLFCEPDSNDFHLAVNSPCLGAGENGETIGALDVGCDSILSVNEELSQIPEKFILHRNYPNPFNPTTTIPFEPPEASLVKIVIYNLLGEKVAVLMDSPLQAGKREITWDGRDHKGNLVSSGVYLIHFQATSLETGKVYNQSMKCMLMR